MGKAILIGGAVLAVLAVGVVGLGLLHKAKAGDSAGGRKPYTSGDGRITLLLPGAPKETTKPVKGGGETRQISLLQEGNLYAVTRVRNPGLAALDADGAAHVLASLDAIGAAFPAGDRLLRNEPIAQGRRPAREVESEAPDHTLTRTRVLVAGDEMFYVTMAGSAQSVHSPEADRFFDSFQIND